MGADQMNKKHEERMLTHYFNIQNLTQLKFVDSLLQIERDKHKENMIFDYDGLKYLNPKLRKLLPQYNEMLREWLVEK